MSSNAREMGICKQILALDNSIRFAGMTNNAGNLFDAEYREGMSPLLTKEETELSAATSIQRMETRKRLEIKLGKTLYALAQYEKVRRCTIPLSDNYSTLLLVSFDNEADHESIMREKIFPLLMKDGFNRKVNGKPVFQNLLSD